MEGLNYFIKNAALICVQLAVFAISNYKLNAQDSADLRSSCMNEATILGGYGFIKLKGTWDMVGTYGISYARKQTELSSVRFVFDYLFSGYHLINSPAEWNIEPSKYTPSETNTEDTGTRFYSLGLEYIFKSPSPSFFQLYAGVGIGASIITRDVVSYHERSKQITYILPKSISRGLDGRLVFGIDFLLSENMGLALELALRHGLESNLIDYDGILANTSTNRLFYRLNYVF